jgi:hypothetical protein
MVIKGTALSLQLNEAHKMKIRHEELLEEFTAGFSDEIVSGWVSKIEAWNADSTQPNPYEEVESCEGLFVIAAWLVQFFSATTMAKVRLELTEEELGRAISGSVPAHEISPHSFLHLGMDLEEQQ